MTRSRQLLTTKFRAKLKDSGREIVAFLPSAKERFCGTLSDEESDVVEISALAGAVSNPRAVTKFMDVATHRNFSVLRYAESVRDQPTWTWICEGGKGR